MKSSILLLTLLSISPLMAMDPSSRSVYPGHQTRQTTQDKSPNSGVYREFNRGTGQVKKQVVNGQDREFAAQQETKRRHELENRKIVIKIKDRDHELENKKIEAQNLEDACAILFKIKERDVDCYKGTGLPKVLQQCVFNYLPEMRHQKKFKGCKGRIHRLNTITDPQGKYRLVLKSHLSTFVFDLIVGKAIYSYNPSAYQQESMFNFQSRLDFKGSNGTNVSALAKGNTIYLLDSVRNSYIGTFQGHTDSIFCLNEITDTHGKQLIASGGWDKTIRLWDPTNCLCIQMLKGHDDLIFCIGTITDVNGKQLIVSGSGDKTIRLWDLTSGTCIHTLKGHNDSVLGISTIIDADGKQLLASGSGDKTIRLWNPTNGTCIHTFEGHEGSVSCICTIPDIDGRQLIASASDDKTLRLWDPINRDLIHTVDVKDFGGVPTCLKSITTDSTGKQLLASGAEDGSVHLWDIGPGKFECAVIDQCKKDQSKSADKQKCIVQ